MVQGLDESERTELDESNNTAGYERKHVSAAAIQVETLLQVINVIVLQDELLVDSEFVDTWDNEESPLRPLRNEHVVLAKPLLEARDEWLPTRDLVQEELCFSRKLSEDFADFRFKFKGDSDPVFSNLLWGTAGMIARSLFLKKPYLGHPSRGRVIQLSRLGAGRADAQQTLNRFIASERVKLFDRITSNHTTRATSLSLPPVALEVIAECHEINDLIPTALQLRDKYRGLREWTGEFQRALEIDPKESAKHKALLEAAAADIDNLFKTNWWSRLSFDITLSLTSLIDVGKSITVPVGAMLQRMQKGSVRTAVSQLIRQPWDDTAIVRLLQMLGGDTPILQRKILTHLRGL